MWVRYQVCGIPKRKYVGDIMNPVTISMDNFDEVFNQYDRYIKAIANKYTIKGYGFDDLVSISYGVLIRCVNHYNEDEGIPFQYYLARAIKREFWLIIKQEGSVHKRMTLNTSKWLDEPLESGDTLGDIVPNTDSLVDVPSLLHDFYEFLKPLNKNKQTIYYQSVFYGTQHKDIAEMLGLQRPNVSFHLKKMQKQFKQLHSMEDYYK